MPALELAFGLTFADLYEREGLAKLDAAFLDQLGRHDAALKAALEAARAHPAALEPKALSELILAAAEPLEDFLVALFGIEREHRALITAHLELDPIYVCKRLFVQRRAAKKHKPEAAAALDGAALEAEIESRLAGPVSEDAFARAVNGWCEDEARHAAAIEAALDFAAWALFSPQGRERFGTGVLFHVPRKRDYEHLVALETRTEQGVARLRAAGEHRRRREGFAATDPGPALKTALDHANYCIWCHNQGKDSCSKGYRDKDGAFRTNPFDETLAGCPLGEKISEMNFAKSHGLPLGALAIVAIDNPLCAATGHHICNDCMKGCIYQKQDPVDIPRVESRTLKDVLDLPWGVEIYSLLTRWNPLNLHRPLPRPFSGKRALVVGLGPAGFNLALHLLNDGHRVVAIDAAKIEPLPARLSGRGADGTRGAFAPVRHVDEFFQPLERRVTGGFGGLAEYGITVRYNKNYLTLIQLILERNERCQIFGGVRFGGAITFESAFAQGFDHVALAVGAGHPTTLALPGGLSRGVRTSSDFLMGLQLSGAAKAESAVNLQLRLPVVVIGGGLTAIDCATEALAYYPFQVEKFKERYETLAAEGLADTLRVQWNEEERAIADEFLAHAEAIARERALARAENRAPRLQELVQGWGGVVIAYRKRLLDSPMYRLNSEEVEFALEEGFEIVERMTPLAIETDAHGHACAAVFETPVEAADAPRRVRLPARSVIVAAGTRPNITAAREAPAWLALAGRYFQARDETGAPVAPEAVAKPKQAQVFAHVGPEGRSVSFHGDAHPSFAGNVVKAMAGAKQASPRITAQMMQTPISLDAAADAAFAAAFESALRARVAHVERLDAHSVLLTVQAPAAARACRPGQFFRLQNFETGARRIEETLLTMEGLALRVHSIDAEQGCLGFILVEQGASSVLAARLRPGEPVILMGPTGAAPELARNEAVLLAGHGLGNALLAGLAPALRAQGCQVLFLASFDSADEAFARTLIERDADAVIWCTAQGEALGPRRAGDCGAAGDPVAALLAYGQGRLGAAAIGLETIDRIYAAGPAAMMAALAHARTEALGGLLKPGHVAIANLHSPMQCMMREVCGQCLQIVRDPETGRERHVFACDAPLQPFDAVDFAHLENRLRQNSVAEKLAAAWIERCLQR